MTTKEILLLAAADIEANGLAIGAYEENGCRCAVGAICVAGSSIRPYMSGEGDYGFPDAMAATEVHDALEIFITHLETDDVTDIFTWSDNTPRESVVFQLRECANGL